MFRLSEFVSNYKPNSYIYQIIWLIISSVVFRPSLPVMSYRYKTVILRAFGANVGRHVVIKPGVQIKNPSLLDIGSDVWIGENVWIDNVGKITIGDNVCISQGVRMTSGNHNYKQTNFELMIEEIEIQNNCWIGCFCNILPGAQIGPNTFLTGGNTFPCSKTKTRDIG